MKGKVALSSPPRARQKKKKKKTVTSQKREKQDIIDIEISLLSRHAMKKYGSTF